MPDGAYSLAANTLTPGYLTPTVTGGPVALLPRLICQVAFTTTAGTGSYLHIGDPTRGIIGVGTIAPAEVWVDVSPHLRSLTVRRGSSRVVGPVVTYEAGTATVVLRDPDRRYDPFNASGPYVSAGRTQVEPMRAFKLLAEWDGTSYELWRGFADSWSQEFSPPNLTLTTLTGTDAFKVFAGISRTAVAPVGAGEDSGTRISRVLDGIEWPTVDRVIATGDTTLQATTLEGEVLAELQLVTETEAGELYVDGGGRVRFRNRQAVLREDRSIAPQAVFGGDDLPFADVVIDYDDTQLVNRARITREGGTEQVADDTDSQDRYLVRTAERTGLLMETDPVARAYATWIVSTSAEPQLRLAELKIQPFRAPELLFPHVLGREIGDRITVTLQPPGGGDPITSDVLIRGIAHEVTASPRTWTTTWTLQAAPADYLIIGHPIRGVIGSNRIAF